MQISGTSAVAASPVLARTQADLLAQSITYSPNINGKTYEANLSLSAGEYVATIPELPNVSADGSSLILAENNLDARIRLLA